jgi:hypothetical protein
MNPYPLSIKYSDFDKYKVKRLITHINKENFEILNYDKKVLCYNDYKNSIYKNVVYSYPEKNLLSFMGQKTMSFKLFASKFSEINYDIHTNFEVTEFISGKVINLFFDNRVSKWCLVTKFQNAKKGYILKETNEIYKQFVFLLKGDVGQNLNSLFCLLHFHKNRTYNFKIRDNKLYLISIFHIEQFDYTFRIKNIQLSHYRKSLSHLDGIIYFPEQIQFKNYEEILEKKDNTDGLPLKYVITHISGMQTNVISKDFEQMKRYNSVPENIQYLYLCLRFIKKNQEYVQQFSRFKQMFSNMDMLYINFIYQVQNAYVSYYITKNDDHKNIYMNWAHKIHKEVFIPSLQKKKIKINRESISEYFSKIQPREMLHIMKMYSIS